MELPTFEDVTLLPADLNDVQPTEYRADMVLVLKDAAGNAVMGIVLEVQLSVDKTKKFTWPVYAATLHARLKCPVCVLVLAGNDRVARWAAKPTSIGSKFTFAPEVLGPSGVPQITESEEACANPELAVLSAMMHGHDADIDTSVRIALAAQKAIETLDDERSRLYYDLVMNALNDAAREVLQNMRPANYEYQSDFARKYYGEGREKGIAEAHVALVLKLLRMRFGLLTPDVNQRVSEASVSALDQIAERMLTATTLEEALGSI